ncbi:MAG: hypothetical protein ACLSG5_14815 [Oscillospiraceae bacterium]
MAKATAAAKPAAPTHSKEQLLRSQRYAKRRDLLGALLEDGKWYTLEEVVTDFEYFMKGKVKIIWPGRESGSTEQGTPGTYINFSSVAWRLLLSGEVTRLCLMLDWGPDSTVFTVTSGDFQRTVSDFRRVHR